MARGRKAKPAAIAELQGNPGRRPLPEEPKAAEGKARPLVPHRRLTVGARRHWDRLVPELSRLNFVRVTDQAALERYCYHLERWWALTEKLRQGETYVSKSKHGDLRRLRPEFIARERVEARLEALEDRFGLSPRARQELLRQAVALPAGGLFGSQVGKGAEEEGGQQQPAPEEAPPAIGALQVGTVH